MRPRVVSSGLFGALVVLGGLVAPASASAASASAAPATAPPVAPVPCPAALPTEQAVDGLTGTGFTVERGTVPEPFTARVLGRVTDGIAPGVDMIMAELDSPAIQRAGVWSGMSGSPVYTSDGTLIGAVGYGLSLAPSPIAGITPAGPMKALLDLPSTSAPVTAQQLAAASGPTTVAISAADAARLAGTGEVTRAQAAGGFSRLRLPVTVSGLTGVSAAHGGRELDRLAAKLPDARMVTSGAAAGTGSSPSDIVAGGNYAAALSFGDVTLAGVGTTTFVCDRTAVAFGHPFLFGGAAAMSVHPATALLVQADAAAGSFKLANPGGPVGTLDQDRLAGIRGQLDRVPTAAPIRTDLTAVGGGSRVGTTNLIHQPFAADVAALHTLANVDRVLDAVGAGSASLRLQIQGVRADGTPFTVSREDSYADTTDIGAVVAAAVYDTVTALVDQPFERVRIASVTLTGTVDPAVNAYQVTSLTVRQGSEYVVPTGPVAATAGGTLPIRLRLAPVGAGTPHDLDLALGVPAAAAGALGTVEVGAGPVPLDVSAATSFEQVVAAVQAAPGAASGRATLWVETGDTPLTATVSASADAAVQGFGAILDVEIG